MLPIKTSQVLQIHILTYTVPNLIDFPRYNTKCRGENEILRGIFRAVSRFSSTFSFISLKFGLLFGQCVDCLDPYPLLLDRDSTVNSRAG